MSSKYDDLEKLADLKNKGIITEEEFNLKKAQILNPDTNKQNINGTNEPNQEENVKEFIKHSRRLVCMPYSPSTKHQKYNNRY